MKSGAGTLRLDYGGLYYHHGVAGTPLGEAVEVGLQVNQGTLVLGNDFSIGYSGPTVWVHGGTLALDSSDLSNPVVVDNGGKLAGRGYFSATSIGIGAGATLAPGFAGLSEIGVLGFTHLELNGGGTYEWHIQDAAMTTAGAAGRDYIDVFGSSTLVVNATSADRFTLKVVSLTLAGTAGLLNGFDPSLGYSWAIIGFDAQTGFDPTKFQIDTTSFANSITTGAGNGAFYLSLSGNQVMLNFSPVPEPSTYALMALGLATTGLAAWRKRRRA